VTSRLASQMHATNRTPAGQAFSKGEPVKLMYRKTTVIVAALLFGFASLSAIKAQTRVPIPGTGHVIPSIDGPTLYVTYCAVCHGSNGEGHGPMEPILSVQIPNLTEIAKRNGGVFPLKRVQRIIAGEKESGLGHGTRKMPIWGPIFSQVTTDQDFGKVRIYNLAKYLESIQK
jgi:Cytochrome c